MQVLKIVLFSEEAIDFWADPDAWIATKDDEKIYIEDIF